MYTPIVLTVDVDRFRGVLKEVRVGKSPIRQGDKLGRPSVSKATRDAFHKIAVSAQTIKNIEDGETQDPGIVTIARIIEAMGVRLSDFFLQVEEPSAPPVRTPPLASTELPDADPDPALVARVSQDLTILFTKFITRAVAAHHRSAPGAGAATPRRRRRGHPRQRAAAKPRE